MNRRKSDKKRVPISFSMTQAQLELIDRLRDATTSKSRTDIIMEGIELLYEEIENSPDYARGFGIDKKDLKKGA